MRMRVVVEERIVAIYDWDDSLESAEARMADEFPDGVFEWAEDSDVVPSVSTT